METTIERLYKLVDIKGDSIYRLSKEIEVSNGYFSKQKQSNGALSSNIIEKIVSYYPDLDANWLLTGKGSMLKNTEYKTLYWRDDETGENISNKLNESREFEINIEAIAKERLKALNDKEKIIEMLEKENYRLIKELQEQRQENEQLKKGLSSVSSGKVGSSRV